MLTSTSTLASTFIPTHPQVASNLFVPKTSKFQIKSNDLPIKLKIPCQSAAAAVTADITSLSEEEMSGVSKEGKRIRVKESIKVYHVMKAPDLDLQGMEGVIKQYVGVWKGKSISANLPFKVEFFIEVEGQEKPVRFFAHLKEDEFEYLDSE